MAWIWSICNPDHYLQYLFRRRVANDRRHRRIFTRQYFSNVCVLRLWRPLLHLCYCVHPILRRNCISRCEWRHITCGCPLRCYGDMGQQLWLLPHSFGNAILHLLDLLASNQCNLRRHLHLRNDWLRLCFSKSMVYRTRTSGHWSNHDCRLRCLFLRCRSTWVVFIRCDNVRNDGITTPGSSSI